ncbi:MAG: hypothetical protein JOZ90_03755 [Alphaproteobacteria bacterium]|nr:hypothetical protein [Alphaproteobacteria bacterium]MBV9372655.1 hypothetical protein [Alphaproteobacteria bacterium]MBV9900195.1 hypothetical protein [Alphaproteobacteria bacterium]
MIAPLLLAALPVPAMAATPPVDRPSESRCGYIVTDEHGTRTVDTPALHVLADTSAEGPYAPPIPAGAALMCGRSSMVPAEGDWKVLAEGRPLYIVDSSPGAGRVACLEMADGRVQYRFAKGRLTVAEAAATERRLNAFQKHLSR